MSRLDRYLLKETALPFLLSVAFAVLLVFLFQAQRLVGAAIGLGMTMLDVAVIFAAALPPFLVLAVPIAYLLSVMIGLGRLAADREIVALRAAGATPMRIARAPLVLGAIVSVAAMPIAHFGEPYGLRVLYARLVDVGLRNIAQAIRPGVFNEDLAGIALYASARDAAGRLEDVLLFDQRDPAQPILMLASRGKLQPRDATSVVFELEAGEIHLGHGGAQDRYERIQFERASVGIDAEREIWERTKFVSDISKMTSAEMLAQIDRRPPSDRYGRKVAKTYWRRWSLPAMAFIFGVIGAAITLSARPNTRAKSALLGLGALIGYHLLLRIGDWLVLYHEHTALAAAFGPDLIALAAGAFALARSGRPR